MAACERVNASCATFERLLCAAAIQDTKAIFGKHAGSGSETPRLLIVNGFMGGKAIVDAAKARGWAYATWLRFAQDGQEAKPLPFVSKAYSACVARLPSTKDAAMMMLDVLAEVVDVGAPLSIWGSAQEGIHSLPTALASRPFDHVRVQCVDKAAGLFCLSMVRDVKAGGDGKAKASDLAIKQWEIPTKISLEGKSHQWTTFPGLFSGGVVDPMTVLLLDSLPVPKAGSAVLDFASGSGVIAAALRARDPSLKLHLLDADAVALKAAEKNVPDAEYYCTDRVSSILEEDDQELDWIVSNPPVHLSLLSNFQVVEDLLADAPQALRCGGSLYFVVQQHVSSQPCCFNRPYFPCCFNRPYFASYRISPPQILYFLGIDPALDALTGIFMLVCLDRNRLSSRVAGQ